MPVRTHLFGIVHVADSAAYAFRDDRGENVSGVSYKLTVLDDDLNKVVVQCTEAQWPTVCQLAQGERRWLAIDLFSGDRTRWKLHAIADAGKGPVIGGGVAANGAAAPAPAPVKA
ncbi:MAG: hypothetical protein OEW41_08730 [Actinomycetota bacterium]|nr:hypothetical protein [Actinomycetota bacterium]